MATETSPPLPAEGSKNDSFTLSASSPIFIMCGPSGVGKGTLINLLQDKYPGIFGFSVSHTTRKPRPKEKDGVDYNFTTVEAIKKDIAANKFIEFAEVHGNFYGTSIAGVEKVAAEGKICILDIDVQGVRQARKVGIQGTYIFIRPPSIKSLEERLRGRNTDSEKAILTRLGNAVGEIAACDSKDALFDLVLVNNKLEHCFKELEDALMHDIQRVQKANTSGVDCSQHPLSAIAPSDLCIECITYPKYSDAEARAYCDKFGSSGEELALRTYTSNLIGRMPSLVLHGGGNTSVKRRVTNALGEEVEVLSVKGSGYALDVIPPEGFPSVDLAHLRKMLKLKSLTDEEMVNEMRTHMLNCKSPNPSVETLLHTLIPHKYVDHSHADAVVALADHDLATAKKLLAEALACTGFKFAVVPYVMPGFGLARATRAVFEAADDDVTVLVLLKHGLFTWGATAKESYERHIEVVSAVEKYIVGKAVLGDAPTLPKLTPRPYHPPSTEFFDRVTSTLRGALYAFQGTKQSWLVAHRESPVVKAFAQSEECAEWSQIGTITPDHVIRCKYAPLVIRGLVASEFYSEDEISSFATAETPKGDAKLFDYITEQLKGFADRYQVYFDTNNARVHGIKTRLDTLPRVLLIEHFGLFTVGASPKACHVAADIYEHTVPTILASMATGEGKYDPCSKADLFDCEYWSLEQAKLKMGKKKGGALSGKVAYVTGGASGIGKGTAAVLAAQGAALCIVDLNAQRVAETLKEFATKFKLNHVLGLTVDVTDPKAVAESYHATCKAFGGVDIVVSNAGIVVQAHPGMASCTAKDLQLSMAVNFQGHVNVVGAAVRRMVAQRTGGVLLFNVSKAPLNPGPKLGPYCIAKAATLALMRQYAVEYGAHGIRSNAVNADRVRTNLFDIKLVEKRAQARGLTAAQYFRSNLLKDEVLVPDVARAFLALTQAEKTTGNIFTVDGGNIAAAPR